MVRDALAFFSSFFAAELMMSFTVFYVLNCVDTMKVFFLTMWPLMQKLKSASYTPRVNKIKMK